MTVGIGDDGGVGMVSLSLSRGHGYGYDCGEKGGSDGAVGMDQRGVGNGQPQLTNGHQLSVGNGQ